MPTEQHTPNWREWAMREYWESLEFARLACGVSGDPMYMLDSALGNRVQEVVLIAERSLAAKSLRFHASPREWLQWAKQKEIEVPGELQEAVSAHTPLPPLSMTNAESALAVDASAQILEDVHPKERNTMLRLLGGLVMTGHGLDLSRPWAAAREIVKDLSAKNIQVSEHTVVKYLKEAAVLLGIRTEKDQ